MSPTTNPANGGSCAENASSGTGINAQCLTARRQAEATAGGLSLITSSSGARAAQMRSKTFERFVRFATGCAMVTGRGASSRGRGRAGQILTAISQ